MNSTDSQAARSIDEKNHLEKAIGIMKQKLEDVQWLNSNSTMVAPKRRDKKKYDGKENDWDRREEILPSESKHRNVLISGVESMSSDDNEVRSLTCKMDSTVVKMEQMEREITKLKLERQLATRTSSDSDEFISEMKEYTTPKEYLISNETWQKRNKNGTKQCLRRRRSDVNVVEEKPKPIHMFKNDNEKPRKNGKQESKIKHIYSKKRNPSASETSDDSSESEVEVKRERSERRPEKRRNGRSFMKVEKYDGTTPLEIFFLQFDN